MCSFRFRRFGAKISGARLLVEALRTQGFKVKGRAGILLRQTEAAELPRKWDRLRGQRSGSQGGKHKH